MVLDSGNVCTIAARRVRLCSTPACALSTILVFDLLDKWLCRQLLEFDSWDLQPSENPRIVPQICAMMLDTRQHGTAQAVWSGVGLTRAWACGTCHAPDNSPDANTHIAFVAFVHTELHERRGWG
jgi:hypothetical protein